MPWILLLLAAAQAPAPAPANVAAVYRVPGAPALMAIRVEVSSNGNRRVEFGEQMMTFIKRDGHLYMVTIDGGRTTVADVEDLKAVAQESLRKSPPGLCKSVEHVPAEFDLVQAGTATVGARTGDAWVSRAAAGKSGAKAQLVISHDSALAPIGAALLEEFRATTGFLPDCPAFRAMFATTEAALTSGTPLLMNKMELTDVREGPVDPKRFELPAPPRSRAELAAAAKDSTPISVELRSRD